MSFRSRIDFEHIYPMFGVSKDLRIASFEAPLQDGSSKILTIRISEYSHELMSNVYNLSFGPRNDRNRIDDKIRLTYLDNSRVFSTILFLCLKYLTCNKNHLVGIDGSDNIRTRLYWNILQLNFNYLSRLFNMAGLKYYVRISRFGKYQYDSPFDFEDIFKEFELIEKIVQCPKQMYNYFVLGLKN